MAQTSNDGVDFHSREGVQKPQLVVRTSPTPPDTVAPLAPTDLAADASSGSEVSLTWTAATDDTAVTAYDIERDGLAARDGRGRDDPHRRDDLVRGHVHVSRPRP